MTNFIDAAAPPLYAHIDNSADEGQTVIRLLAHIIPLGIIGYIAWDAFQVAAQMTQHLQHLTA